MSREEIINIMSRRRNVAYVPQYKQIYHIATGKPFRGCLCGNGFDNLWRVCTSHAEALKVQIANENKNKDTTIITQ